MTYLALYCVFVGGCAAGFVLASFLSAARVADLEANACHSDAIIRDLTQQVKNAHREKADRRAKLSEAGKKGRAVQMGKAA